LVKNVYIEGVAQEKHRTSGGTLMPVKVNKEECVACGACVDACPEGAITCDDVAVIDVKKCLDCGACVDECPNSAISVDEKK
jgi:NAD-dependent dihydropyrimidine dehydrogenase PreA subunit